jgi:hypothetical protein
MCAGETEGEGKMIASSNETKTCWFCNLGADHMCLKPRLEQYGLSSALCTCNGHRLLRFTISGSLVRGIASLFNRSHNTKG